ncbi:MAG TPA: hypothetical protein VGL06_03885 [Pseudonocardiaceae bacterium]
MSPRPYVHKGTKWDGATVVKQHLDTILPVLERKPDLWIKLSLGTEPDYSHDWK